MAKAKSELSELATVVGDQILQNRRDIAAKAEALLRISIEENRTLTFDEQEFLRVDAGFDPQRIQSERFRITRVVNNQMAAGTSAERIKLDNALAQAEAALSQRRPALEQQISSAQAELNSLSKSVEQYTKRKGEVEAALQTLTQVVCPATASRFSAKRSLVKSTLGREVSDLSGKIHFTENVLNGDPNDNGYWVSLKHFDFSLAVVIDKDGWRTHRYADHWPTVAAELRAKLPAMKEELAKLETRLAEELELVKTELQQYWR